jgi:hypothetical protein
MFRFLIGYLVRRIRYRRTASPASADAACAATENLGVVITMLGVLDRVQSYYTAR